MAASVSGAAAAPSYAAYGDDLAQLAGPSHGSRTIHVHPVSSYSFGVKPARPEKDASVAAAMLRHRRAYEREGARRIVEAILLVNQHNHPHVLLLQSGGGGGPIRDVQAPRREAQARRGRGGGGSREAAQQALPRVGAHAEGGSAWSASRGGTDPGSSPTTTPTSLRTSPGPRRPGAVFACQLPDTAMFAVPRNLKLLAVPLFELYANENRYGAIVASVPHHVSRFNLNLEEPRKEPTKPTEEMPADRRAKRTKATRRKRTTSRRRGGETRGRGRGAAAAAAAGE